jgi:hypothetical protein
MFPKGARGVAGCTFATPTNRSSDTLTGRRLASTPLFKRPSRYCFRHLNTRLGFNAYCCATRGTDAPGSNVSSTILCFSEMVQWRCLIPCLEVSTLHLVDTKKVSTKAIMSTSRAAVETALARRLRCVASRHHAEDCRDPPRECYAQARTPHCQPTSALRRSQSDH